MAHAFDRTPYRCGDVHQNDQLMVSLATPVWANQKGNDCLINGDGLTVFGDATLYNSEAVASDAGTATTGKSDLAIIHDFVRNEGDLAKLNGDFAFGVYDRQTQRLSLVRDQIGIRIVYFAKRPEGLVFSSFIHALFETGIDRTRLDPQALASYLALLCPGAGKSFFPEISELEAAHCLSAGPNGQIAKRRYWALEADSSLSFTSDGDWVHHLREDLVRSVRKRTMGSNRIAVQLSGGLDSSSIAGILCSEFPELAITGYFHQPSMSYPEVPDDDFPYLAALEEKWPNLRIAKISSANRHILSGPEHWYSTAASPCIDAFQFAEDALAEAALDDDVEVVMTGEGGDDGLSIHARPQLSELALNRDLRGLFAEFRRLRNVERRSILGIVRNQIIPPFVPVGAKNIFRKLAGRPWHEELAINQDLIADKHFRDHLRNCGLHSLVPASLTVSGQIRSNYSSTMAPYYTFGERVSQTNGYRVQNPMLDIELLRSVCSAPSRLFVSDHQDRALIRDVARPFLPPPIRDRPGKAPFIPDYFVRLEAAVPALSDAFDHFSACDLWMDVCDARKPKQVLSDFRHKTNDEADYSRMIQHVLLPYFLGRFIELTRESSF